MHELDELVAQIIAAFPEHPLGQHDKLGRRTYWERLFPLFRAVENHILARQKAQPAGSKRRVVYFSSWVNGQYLRDTRFPSAGTACRVLQCMGPEGSFSEERFGALHEQWAAAHRQRRATITGADNQPASAAAPSASRKSATVADNQRPLARATTTGAETAASRKSATVADKQPAATAAADFEARVRAEVNRRVTDIIIPGHRQELAEAREVLRTRKGVFSAADYKAIRNCLHPDRIAALDPDRVPAFREAFQLFEGQQFILRKPDPPANARPIPAILVRKSARAN